MAKEMLRALVGVGTLALAFVAFLPSSEVEALPMQSYRPEETCCYSATECPCVRTWCYADSEWSCLIANCPPRSQCKRH